MGEPYENEEEMLRHFAAAEGLSVSWDKVRSLYESVLAEMKRDARIMDFLPILAVRKVKEILSHRGSGGLQGDYP